MFDAFAAAALVAMAALLVGRVLAALLVEHGWRVPCVAVTAYERATCLVRGHEPSDRHRWCARCGAPVWGVE